MQIRTFPYLSVAFALATGCAEQRSDMRGGEAASTPTEEGLNITNGTESFNGPATGVLINFAVMTDGTWKRNICTATLMCSRAIITASHCFLFPGSAGPPGKTIATVRTEFRLEHDVQWIATRMNTGKPMPTPCENGGSLSPQPFCSAVTKFVQHPAYRDSAAYAVKAQYDVAVGRLALPAPTATVPNFSCQLPPEPTGGSQPVVGLVGYGVDGSLGDSSIGIKRSGTAYYAGKVAGDVISMSAGPSGQRSLPGDSGGPIMNGPSVIGVNSYKNDLPVIGGYQYAASFMNTFEWIQAISTAYCNAKEIEGPSTASDLVDCTLGGSSSAQFTTSAGKVTGQIGVSLGGNVTPGVTFTNCPVRPSDFYITQTIGYQVQSGTGEVWSSNSTSKDFQGSTPKNLRLPLSVPTLAQVYTAQLPQVPTNATKMVTYGSLMLNSFASGGPAQKLCTRQANIPITYIPPVTTTVTISASKAGTGIGVVGSTDGKINCGSMCSATYSAGAQITLTATAISGSTFAGWSGACIGVGNCNVTLNQSKAVTATFNVVTTQPPPGGMFLLSVSKAGPGSGFVTSPGLAINCGSICAANFNADSLVTLTATPNAGSTFGGWAGSCNGMSVTCTVTMNQARSTAATFNLGAPGTFTLTVMKTGNGSVMSQPAGINCGTVCSAQVVGNASITLTPVAMPGSHFVGWGSGPCAGLSICTLSISAPTLVNAQFMTP